MKKSNISKMKIIDVVKNSVWFDPRVRKQILTYSDAGHSVTAIGIHDDRFSDEEIRKLPCKSILPYSLLKRKKTALGKIFREINSNRAIAKAVVKEKPDCIHANDLNALIPCYTAFRRLRKKPILIYDTHELFLENPWMRAHKFYRFVWGIFEKRIIKKADQVICVTQSAADFLKKKYGVDNITIISNSVRKESILSPKQWTNGHFEVLNQGQYYEGRGYPETIEAASLVKNRNICFVLRGLGDFEKYLRKLKDEKKAENVIFATPVKTSELIAAASESNVGVAFTKAICANYLYSISNKIFEYAAAGLPVIMSNIPEHKILNDKFHFGIIIGKDCPEEIAEAADKYYSDKSFYERCSKNAILMATETCWDNQFASYLKILSALFAKRKGK